LFVAAEVYLFELVIVKVKVGERIITAQVHFSQLVIKEVKNFDSVMLSYIYC
jgi:hypothetical protein